VLEDDFRVERRLDATRLAVRVHADPGASVRQTGPHEFVVTTVGSVLDLGVAFGPGVDVEPVAFADVLAASGRRWPRFWSSGGAVELHSGADDPAPAHPRRVGLCQYLTAIQRAGTLPPAETGLLANSWRGRFHLEMHWCRPGPSAAATVARPATPTPSRPVRTSGSLAGTARRRPRASPPTAGPCGTRGCCRRLDATV
jgi:hypothetical protein